MLKLNNNEIKLVVSDIDGTVAYRTPTNSRYVSPKTIEAIRSLREQQVYFVFNTGSSYILVDRISDQFEAAESKYTKYIISVNGNSIYNFENKKSKTKALLDKEMLKEIQSELDHFGLEMMLLNDTADRIYFSTEEQAEEFKDHLSQEWEASVSLIKSQSDMTDAAQASIKLLKPEFKAEAEFILQKYSSEIDVTWWSEFGLDICPKGVNKFTGLRDLIKLINEVEGEEISLENVIYFGDQNNDLSVFRNHKQAIAMGNSIEEIKDLAFDITDTVQNDGFAKYIKKIT